jgi:tetratricopeptide (TPR) repeat protein
LLFPFFRKLNKKKTFVLVVIFLIIGILFSTKLYHFKKDSADGRLLIWTVSWNLFKEKPLTGFGPNGFQKNYMLRQGDYLKNHTDSPWAVLADDVQFPFNEFIQTGIEQGITGLLFISGIVYITAKAQNAVREQAILMALTVFACFSYPLEYIEFQALGVLSLASISHTQKPAIILSFPFIKKILICSFIAIGGLSLYSFYNYTLDVKHWKKAHLNIYNDNDKSIEEFQELYSEMKYNASFVKDYAWGLFLSERYEEATAYFEKAVALKPSAHLLLQLGESCQKTGKYNEALETYEKASYMVPSLFKPHCETAKLLFKQGKYEEAKQKAKEILNKKIKIDHPKIDRMKREMQAILNEDSTIN